MTDNRPYSVTSLAERWECSESMIRELLAQGRLRGFRLGGKLWRISAGEVARWESGEDTGSDPTGSDSYTERPSRRGGKRGSAGGSDSRSEQRLRGELRLIGSLDGDKP